MADSPRFSYPFATLQQLASDVLADAKAKGATACEVDVSEGFGQSVTVRCGEVETIEYNRDKGVGVTIYSGRRKGYASTSDFSPQALRDTVSAALDIARFTAEDDCAGLAEAAELAGDCADLDLHHPWVLPVEAAIDIASRCEQAAFDASPRIGNSEGATVSTQEAQFVSANSLGFMGGYPTSRHYIACSVIAGEQDEMQRDDWYTTRRLASELEAAEAVGATAAQRAVARLGGRKVKTGEVPVLFEAPLAAALLGSFVHAASGGALYRKASFLVDHLGKPVFSNFVNIVERPFIPRGLGSAPFDNDGVATRDRQVVSSGVLDGYFLGVYTARKLGLKTTGNAGGSHNLIIEPGVHDFAGLLKQMGRGLVVTELLGHGINYVTGDYSRGAAGFWVENGEIAYPVEEITIAGNLKDMLRGIVAVGRDVQVRGSKQTGSILVDRMTVAGAATTLAAPAIAAELPSIKWRLTSSFPKSLDTIYGGAEVLANRLRAMTNGKFDIRVFAGGEIVPGLQALDAVQQGTVECCHTCSYYYVGKDRTFGFGTAIPFGMNARQMNAWIYYGGGQKLLDEFYADYNVVSFAGGNTGTQMGGWFRKEVKTLGDLKGLKMRIAGLGGAVFAALGAVPQQIAGGDIYPALEKGTIDAAEWVGPYDDEKLGFYKVAKNYYYPGWWEPGPVIHFFVNKAEWAKLPKEYQEAFQAAAFEANVTMMAEYDHKNPMALSKLLQSGVKLRSFSPQILEAAYKAAQQLYADESAKNPAFKKIFTEFDKYRRTQNAWFSVAEMRMDAFLQTHR